MKKGQIYEGIIERVDFPNKGMIYIPEEEKYVTVKNGIPGQKVRFMINKFKRGNGEGRLLEVLEKSPLETREPVCSIFPACGGCMYQTMSYEEQVKMKEGQIHRIMDPVVKGDYIFESVKESPKEFHYRNKMEFSFGDEYKDGPLSLGLHKKGSTYDVLTAADCQLVHRDMNQILSCVLAYFREWNVSYYKKMQHTGYLRHLLLRRGDTTGEILVNLVTTTQEEHDLTELKEQLLELPLEGKIVGILHILNDSLSDVVKSDETRILYGQDFFYEKLLGLQFKITPFSFFQPNSRGAEVLYETVREYIGDIENKTVFDLFSGTGTIGLIAASQAKEVIGVELNRDAVKDAIINAKRNNIQNEQFYNADAGKFMVELAEQNEKVDVVFMDPPRSGSDEAFLSSVVKLAPKKVVYVSCNPETLARDLKYLTRHGYQAVECQPCDMFPFTKHVETIVALHRTDMSGADNMAFSIENSAFSLAWLYHQGRNYRNYSDGMQKRRKYGALVLRDIAVEIQYVPETWCDDAEGKRLRYETYAKQFMERFKKAA